MNSMPTFALLLKTHKRNNRFQGFGSNNDKWKLNLIERNETEPKKLFAFE